jgi:hypothetical protein
MSQTTENVSRRWKDIKQVFYEVQDSIHQAEDRKQWRARENGNELSTMCVGFLDQLRDYQLPQKYCVPCS